MYAMFPLRVARVERVTPHMIRVTLGGTVLQDFATSGPDQRVKLFFPVAGVDEPPILEGGLRWYEVWCATPVESRPVMRTYTIRAHRPEVHEIDIDFYDHGDIGPASAWARRAGAGSPITVLGPTGSNSGGADHNPPADAAWQLITGDETALPAISRIVEAAPAHADLRVYVEVADAAERQDLPWVTWVLRDGAPAGARLNAVVRAADLPTTPGYAWLAGESAGVRDLRRHLVGERGFDRKRIHFCGYWRKGRTESDAQVTGTWHDDVEPERATAAA
ncbi:siderophore-interacting protein [Virgisporangium aliadipatigenens]|uniref:Siderophore-interacting protein n=1 Tax=Virgisporangium aliadipatigenens TaxID=741659 RepID=A0A8J3YJC1_9ACTN|nr:siderophore-interacting protein [Virgisporangium aliadipatigenens]GIJ44991.1 siderophore-interacting protein [Virgisporangium aliadipatigenens]